MKRTIYLLMLIAFVFGCKSNSGSDKKALAIVKQAATNFGKNYSPDYLTLATAEKYVLAEDTTLCQAMVAEGVFAAIDFHQRRGELNFSDRHSGAFMETSLFATQLFMPGQSQPTSPMFNMERKASEYYIRDCRLIFSI